MGCHLASKTQEVGWLDGPAVLFAFSFNFNLHPSSVFDNNAWKHLTHKHQNYHFGMKNVPFPSHRLSLRELLISPEPAHCAAGRSHHGSLHAGVSGIRKEC